MSYFSYALERLRRRQRLRYWAVALPLVILAVAMPVLRPLRYPNDAQIATDEYLRLATIRQLATHATLRLPVEPVGDGPAALPSGVPESRRGQTIPQPDGTVAAAQEPMLAVLGAACYEFLRLVKVRWGANDVLGPYLLTLLLATVPTAVTASFLYRSGRLIELGRDRRMFVALAGVACSGLLPYASVISPYPLAAMCAVGAMTCLAQAAMGRPPPGGAAWLVLAGLLAAMGAAIHPSVAALGACLGLTTLRMPWRRRTRVAGLAIFLIGAALPLTAHRALTRTIGAGWIIPSTPDRGLAWAAVEVRPPPPPPVAGDVEDAEITPPASRWAGVGRLGGSIVAALAGPWGLMAYAPAAVLGMAGVARVFLRHWPKATRGFAAASLLGFAVPMLALAIGGTRVAERMFGPQAVVAALPALVFFAGPLFRNGWSPASTFPRNLAIYLILLASAAVSAIGLLHPYAMGGYRTYSPWEVMQEIWRAR